MAKTTRSIGFNPNKPNDALVMSWLDEQQNKSEYMKELVIKDIQKHSVIATDQNVLKPKLFRGKVS